MFKFDHVKEMIEELKYITNLREDDDRWKVYCKKYKDLWYQIPRDCSIHFKRDHKKQKRIQCGINNYCFIKLKKNYRFEILE